MKIYIANISLDTINNNKDKLKEYCINKNGKNIYELYSEDSGIYITENSKFYKLEIDTDENYELIKNYNNLFTLLIDKTKYKKILVISQMPLNYILIKTIKYEYKINKTSNLSLIIEYILNNNELVIHDFYFNYKENSIDIKNIFFQEELNMFLFNLN